MRYDGTRAGSLGPALDALFAARVREGRAPASVYALIAEDHLVRWGGFADEAVCPEPTADTAFRIASCTKSFTAAVALQQRDAGRLDLDAPLDEYLDVVVLRAAPMPMPSAPVPGGQVPAASITQGPMPTVRQALAMSAGFPTDDPWGDRQESLTSEAFDVLAAGGLRLVHAPGARFEYSNLGFALVGRVLERVTGRRYIDLVREDVVEPLGLQGIGFDPSVAADAVATGFARFGDVWQAQPVSAPGAFSPIGGVFATPRALAAWVAWLAAAWQSDTDDAVLSAASRRELQTPLTPIPGIGVPSAGKPGGGYALGLTVEHDARHGTIVSHSGGYPGFGAHMRWHTASGIGVLGLENGRYSAAFAGVTKALTTVLDAVAIPDELPPLWPETLAARGTVESLLRGWNDDLAAALFAENVAMDEPLDARRAHLRGLASDVGIDRDTPVADLLQAGPRSRSAAHLSWSSAGTAGSLRCEILLTPEATPRVQTLRVGLG